jgi:hypothetical protein
VGRGLSLADTVTGPGRQNTIVLTTNKVYPNGYIAVGYLLFVEERIKDHHHQSLVPIPPVLVSRVNTHSGGVLARALPEGL